MSIDIYSQFIAKQQRILRGESKPIDLNEETDSAFHTALRAGAKHIGVTLAEPINTTMVGKRAYVHHEGGLAPTHILAPFSGSPDDAYHAGLSHGMAGYSKMAPPSKDHPTAEAYNKGHEAGSFLKGSSGSD